MPKLKSLKKIVGKAKQLHEAHLERHRFTGYGFVLADSIDYLNPEQWDRATANSSVFLSRNYLRALEAAGPENSRQRYALIFRSNQPIAAVSAQSVRVSADHVPKSAIRKPVARSLKQIRQQILICGNLFSWGAHGVAFAAGENPEALWPAIAEALYRIRRADRLLSRTDLVMIKDIPGTMMPTAGALKRISYRSLETEPNMVLSLSPQWRSYDDYLAALTANYRKAARKIAEEVHNAGCVVERLDGMDRHKEVIHDLYLQVHVRQRMRLVTLNPAFLPMLAATFGKDFRCTVIRRDNAVLGFVTTLKDGDTAVGYYIGFDSQANGELPIYFRLLHAVIEDAIQLECREVSFGRTALEPKARLGAKPEPFHIWVRHRVPALNLIVHGVMQTISHEDAPDRSPFKPPKAQA